MNKLRELIEAESKETHLLSGVDIELTAYLRSHAEAIADLIDAAQAMKTACSTGYVGNDGKPMGVRVPEKIYVNDLRAALDKLLEPK